MVYGLLSRSGLVRGCNHYLVEGSEFDHHVANYLFGSERRGGVGRGQPAAESMARNRTSSPS